jgi:hypothetical protein
VARKTTRPRKFRIQVYFSEEEYTSVRDLAETTGADMSTSVRMLTKMGIDAMTIPPKKETTPR